MPAPSPSDIISRKNGITEAQFALAALHRHIHTAIYAIYVTRQRHSQIIYIFLYINIIADAKLQTCCVHCEHCSAVYYTYYGCISHLLNCVKFTMSICSLQINKCNTNKRRCLIFIRSSALSDAHTPRAPFRSF